MSLLVKICGLTRATDVEASIRFGYDAVGFNFYTGSPRCIAVGEAIALAAKVPAGIWKAGVFVNQPREEVAAIAAEVGLDTLQFSGDEDLEYCQGWPGYRVVKALRIASTADLTEFGQLDAVVDHVLLDRFSPSAFGGTGEEIPDDILRQPEVSSLLHSVLLSGGLRLDNVAAKVTRYRPFGVDVASGVEQSPGVKDHDLLKQFIERARGA